MPAKRPSLRQFLLYFVRLGAIGFGGPIVLSAHMRRDLVDRRAWVSAEDYEQGLALAQLAPGPLAAQLAIYLGWVHSGALGATLVGLAFVLPSFFMVLGLGFLYRLYSGLGWIQSLFYGIGAAVIGIMAQGAYKLLKKTVGKDRFYWAMAATSTVFTAATESEIIWFFLGAGALAVIVKGRFDKRLTSRLLIFPPLIAAGTIAAVGPPDLWSILGFFAKAGSFVFGSGLAIVPFLHGGVVTEHHWLTDQQFLDAVAVAMITPGPVVITVAFIGYLIAGLGGAAAAAVGVFLPCYFFVVIPAPYFRKFAHVAEVRYFIGGVTSAAVGAIAGAAIVLGRRAIIDIPTAVIGAATLATLLFAKKIPEPFLILIAGAIGLAIAP